MGESAQSPSNAILSSVNLRLRTALATRQTGDDAAAQGRRNDTSQNSISTLLGMIANETQKVVAHFDYFAFLMKPK
jgi:hypothetical protein